MSEEIKKEAQDMELNTKDMDNVAGGNRFAFTEEELKMLDAACFRQSGVCPRCRKTFADQSEIENHILSWDAGQK